MNDIEKIMASKMAVPEGMVDFAKLRELSKAIQNCINTQDALYPLEPVLPLIDFLLNGLDGMDDKSLYEISRTREP